MTSSDLLARCSYPASLPVSQHADEIVSAIKQHQLVVIAGYTGSGKTTQLPKMCLAAGFGAKAQIAHTQPRRIAAITVAERIADELQSELGQDVGYQVRFDREYANNCSIKLQTDGVLLNHIQRDPLLKQYDCIIVDEAHERSLNIDFLLGYLKRLLPLRPDLHVVITSATIDTERFAQFFGGASGGVRVIEVEGKTFPVEFQYRDYDIESGDALIAIADAVAEIETCPVQSQGEQPAADILCFLSTEQEIVDAGRFLRGRLSGRFDVLPLYARLPAKQQRKVFQRPASARRRLILATNIAETSLTVPAIGFVIDSGFCRLSRYNFHNKIQQLPIEEISQASANQRAGRCGRLAPGLCIRLYSQKNFSERPEFSEPEILRTNLAAVILRLFSIGIEDIEEFEFLDPPDGRLLRDGLRLLEELQALQKVKGSTQLSAVGRSLARLPLEPRLGRILLAGGERNCVRECLIICASLSTIDPRERPPGRQEQADALHKRFADPRSDFIAILKLWRYLEGKKRDLSQGAFRKLLNKEFLSWQRIQDWFDVHQQLASLANDHQIKANRKAAGFEAVHRALLSGFVTQIGVLEEKREYRGTRERQFRIFPGSVLARKPPKLVMAAEIVETGSVFARRVAKINPVWVLDAAPHLLKRTLSEPFFDSERGDIQVHESSSLQGLPLSVKRCITFPTDDKSAAQVARQVFLQQALVAGQWQSNLEFNEHNRGISKRADELVARLRRPELNCLADSLLDRFERYVPANIFSVRQFEKWYATLAEEGIKNLCVPWSEALTEDVSEETLSLYPDTLNVSGNPFAVRYRFEPGGIEDGLEVLVPESLRQLISAEQFDLLVPGMLAEKCTALLKTLPKSKRRPMVPIADSVQLMLEDIQAAAGPLLYRLRSVVSARYKVNIETEDWDVSRLPEYLFVRLSLVGRDGQVVRSERCKDGTLLAVDDLKSSEPQDATTGHSESREWFTHGEFDGRLVEQGNYPELPGRFQYRVLDLDYIAYPALVQTENEIRLCLFHQQDSARLHTSWALARLYQQAMAQQARALKQTLFADNQSKLALSVFPAREQFIFDCHQRLFFEAFNCASIRPENAQQWKQQLKSQRALFETHATEWAAVMEALIAAHYELVRNSQSVSSSHFNEALKDVNQQLKGLLCEGFLKSVPAEYLRHYPRYVRAAAQRVTRLREQQGRDAERQVKVNKWETLLQADVGGRARGYGLQQTLYWLLQEYRVSLFAQALGTAVPVSETRLKAAWESRFETDIKG